jgi:CHAT domain-containing protein
MVQQQINQVTQPRERVLLLLTFSQLALQLQNHPQAIPSSTISPLLVHQMLTQALDLAQQQQDYRSIAYAEGFLGQLYEKQQRYVEAQQLTMQAIFHAQNVPELLYLWEAQSGRLWQAQHDLSQAKSAYQRALDYLQPIRARLTIGQRNIFTVFREHFAPVYYGLADVLLLQATSATTAKQKNSLLIEAQQIIEQLKTAELQDYFQDECVSMVTTKATALDELGEHTAVFYPILLPNRIELLLNLPTGIRQFTVPIPLKQLGEVILTFRKNLQTITTNLFIEQATQLYEWLITPLQAELVANKINTLVVVPEGLLRTIPLTALYEAKQEKFLLQQLAVVTTPSLTLTDPRPLPRENVNILINGLSKGVQDFPPLPNVLLELKEIQGIFSHNKTLLNQTFLEDNFSQALKTTPYLIVHIASHGQFSSDPQKTFLLTYDKKLTMNKLEELLRVNETSAVELLTLSACQTAVGDERAALGLAGVAIKAGARSALASLWFVNDNSTSQLISEFYRLLKNSQLSKAQALQQAQLQLLEGETFSHPAYWAPFLLIGNWL